MSSVYISRTNQKLNFARLHLDQLKGARESVGWSKHALVESFNESVLFHLACAYGSLLREIAEVYRAEPASIDSLEQLEVALSAQGVETPEVRELKQLLAAEGWLSAMLGAYNACWSAEDRVQAQSASHASLSEIHVIQVNPDHNEEGAVIEQLEQWLDGFRELVDRLRASMKEW
ncbi:DUF6586 family protein [Motiliproteus sp. SC1-56]|uniref:DUF6586 family protein n=1 Tax=Motiliproteus sp. SC1-56 TaxID=2799565 RepID=UPI001A904503|nr:DUF6586 family protein [Motiliproteus sp. SC1-56]